MYEGKERSLLTGREALIAAVRPAPAVAERLHGDCVVCSTGDASHEAVRVLGVAAGVTARRRQRGDERVCAFSVRP